MWYLNDNVYFVEGKINGAFYDFNNGRLVHVSKDAKELLRKIPGNESFTPTQNEREYLDRLTELHLLTHEHTQPHEISDLRENPVIDFVWVEVTDICNLKCLHCYNESESHCGRVIDSKAWYCTYDPHAGKWTDPEKFLDSLNLD